MYECYLGSVPKDNIHQQFILKFEVTCLHLELILVDELCRKISREMIPTSQLEQIKVGHKSSHK